MKALFFSILIFNMAFFLWEYRKGAPEVYYPEEEHEILSDNTQQIIFLPEEMPERVTEIKVAEVEVFKQNDFFDGDKVDVDEPVELALVEENSIPEEVDSGVKESLVEQSEAVEGSEDSLIKLDEYMLEVTVSKELLEAPVVAKVNPENVISEDKQSVTDELSSDSEELALDVSVEKTADFDEKVEEIALCFQISEKMLEPVQQKIKDYSSIVISKTEQVTGYYFLLTLPSQSLSQMQSNAQAIKQKGLDVWLIEKGEFSQRISLGVFSKQKNVTKAKMAYMKKIGQPLEIIPQYKNEQKNYLKVTLAEDKKGDVMARLSDFKLKSTSCSAIVESDN
ncbi:MAG: hypothetical protein PSN04_10345 [Methyloprofundus sp.]|nr:hypothetical protein [Methyloprofundus sp.]